MSLVHFSNQGQKLGNILEKIDFESQMLAFFNLN